MKKTKELIAVGAPVAAHCQPCLRHHFDQAEALGIGKAEITEAVAGRHYGGTFGGKSKSQL